jgi:lysophospholipase L1-like esterase
MASMDHASRVADLIGFAEEAAGDGRDAAAAQGFATARAVAVSMCDPQLLGQRVRGTYSGLAAEREQYRAIIAKQRGGDRQVLVLADSLGLPRPDAKSGSAKGADQTYAMKLLEKLPTHAVESHCQRYFTTFDVLSLLRSDDTLGASADVVVHVGLNDCATRMFLERDRLALDLLEAETKDRVVSFAQRHRKLLLRELPSLHYVDPDQFSSNLDAIVRVLRDRDAGRIVLATIILPPERFWQATPGLQRNFARYNLLVMEVAARHDAAVLDIDRHVWEHQHQDVLLADGMHLSPAGHDLFADRAASLLQ